MLRQGPENHFKLVWSILCVRRPVSRIIAAATCNFRRKFRENERDFREGSSFFRDSPNFLNDMKHWSNIVAILLQYYSNIAAKLQYCFNIATILLQCFDLYGFCIVSRRLALARDRTSDNALKLFRENVRVFFSRVHF